MIARELTTAILDLVPKGRQTATSKLDGEERFRYALFGLTFRRWRQAEYVSRQCTRLLKQKHGIHTVTPTGEVNRLPYWVFAGFLKMLLKALVNPPNPLPPEPPIPFEPPPVSTPEAIPVDVPSAPAMARSGAPTSVFIDIRPMLSAP